MRSTLLLTQANAEINELLTAGILAGSSLFLDKGLSAFGMCIPYRAWRQAVRRAVAAAYSCQRTCLGKAYTPACSHCSFHPYSPFKGCCYMSEKSYTKYKIHGGN